MDIMLERLIQLIGEKHGATKELAEHLGLTGNNITNWKAGRSDAYRKYLPQIAEYYGVSLDWLSGLSDDMGKKEKPDANNDTEPLTLDMQLIQMLPKMSEQEKKMFLAQLKGVIASREQ